MALPSLEHDCGVAEGKGKADTRAELRVRPVVQGAVVVLENNVRSSQPADMAVDR